MAPRIGMIRPELIVKSVQDFFHAHTRAEVTGRLKMAIFNLEIYITQKVIRLKAFG